MKNNWLDRLDPKQRRERQQVIIGLRKLTRDEANEWLLRVDDAYQRNLGGSTVQRYRADMNCQDDWIPATNIIAFDRLGRLINGMHTLTAFAGSSLDTLLVVWEINMHPRAYLGFDYNRKRTPADALKWEGHEKTHEKQAAATVLWQYESGFFAGRSFRGARGGEKFPSPSQIKRTVDMHPGMEKHLWKNPFRGKGFSIGAMNAASYIFDSIDPKLAAEFFEMFIEGIRFLTPRDPINVLRKEFLNMGERERERNGYTLLKFFKAWNAHIRGETVPGPLVKKDDAFVDPIDPTDLEPRHPKSAGAVN